MAVLDDSSIIAGDDESPVEDDHSSTAEELSAAAVDDDENLNPSPVDDESSATHGFFTKSAPMTSGTHSCAVVKWTGVSAILHDAGELNSVSDPVAPTQVRVALIPLKSLHVLMTSYDGVESGTVHPVSVNTSTVVPSTKAAALMKNTPEEKIYQMKSTAQLE